MHARREFLVIGGGIGGLSAALALALRGMPVRVLEKAPEFTEIGYGLQMGPNAYHVMRLLGIAEQVEAQSVHPRALILMDALTDRGLTRIATGAAFQARYRFPYIVVHRRDLHGALYAACRTRGEIALMTSKEFTAFTDHGDRVTVTCADGSEYEGRALIAADGLHSCARELLLGDGPPRIAGHFVYRGVVPIDEVRNQSYFDSMVIWCGPDLHFVQYRLRGGTVMNYVATFVSEQFRRGLPGFGGADELLQAFAQTAPAVRDMLGHVGKDKNWILYDREPVPNWTRGNVTLLGDAAHPTLQYLAQGACMAMEDAVVLAAKLERAGADVNSAFLAYQGERYLRTARVQITSRIFGDIMHARGGARDLRNHLMAQRTPDTTWEIDWLYRAIEV
ncbi:MAG: FAD-dependent monooxygenase [Betaproteobacteria bacterium]|nr:FAD-dependent monooxygenase [Betaproteobacteria bacterium]